MVEVNLETKEKLYQIDLVDGNYITHVSQTTLDALYAHKLTFPQEDLFMYKKGENVTFAVKISQIQSICEQEDKKTTLDLTLNNHSDLFLGLIFIILIVSLILAS